MDRDADVPSTLVLPGGGARGAYQAGAIEGLRRRSGVNDGEALPGVNAVVGTSIGAINGWFVATARYSQLAEIWQTIAAARIFRVKKQYAGMPMPSSIVLTRMFVAALAGPGRLPVSGLIDGDPIRRWLTRHIDAAAPFLTNYVLTLTNVKNQQGEIFYRTRQSADPAEVAARLRALLGDAQVLREIEDAHLIGALAGSSAVPALLDPVTIDFADGSRTYIDGGMADKAPIALARVFADRVDLVLVDAMRGPSARSPNAALTPEVVDASFNFVLESALFAAKREQPRSTNGSGAGLYFMRPQRELPVQVAAFDDAAGIAATYELGRQAGLRGFREFDSGSVVA